MLVTGCAQLCIYVGLVVQGGARMESVVVGTGTDAVRMTCKEDKADPDDIPGAANYGNECNQSSTSLTSFAIAHSFAH